VRVHRRSTVPLWWPPRRDNVSGKASVGVCVCWHRVESGLKNDKFIYNTPRLSRPLDALQDQYRLTKDRHVHRDRNSVVLAVETGALDAYKTPRQRPLKVRIEHHAAAVGVGMLRLEPAAAAQRSPNRSAAQRDLGVARAQVERDARDHAVHATPEVLHLIRNEPHAREQPTHRAATSGTTLKLRGLGDECRRHHPRGVGGSECEDKQQRGPRKRHCAILARANLPGRTALD